VSCDSCASTDIERRLAAELTALQMRYDRLWQTLLAIRARVNGDVKDIEAGELL
jgi:hypothetical protein